MEDHHKELPWYEYELKIRDLNQRSMIEYEKLSSDYSKIATNNLFILNAGGLGILPALSIFLGTNELPTLEKLQLYKWPLIWFGVGLFFAFICTYSAYLNYQNCIRNTRASMRNEVFKNRASLPIYMQNQNIASIINDEIKTSETEEKLYYQLVRRFLYIATVSGFSSLASFVGGIYCILQIIH